MNLDDYKLDTPDEFDTEDGKTCRYCGEEIEDGAEFCSNYCRKGYLSEL